jgi:hypothetical protein
MRIETKGGKMFDGNGFTLGLRRFRRSTVCIARNLDEAARLPELDGMLGELQLWAIGMPWVAQSRSGARERLKLFVLDCAPLSCHEPWFAISAVDDDTDDVPGVVVVLSDAVAERATSIGGGAGIAPIGRQRSITVIGLPTSEQELRALQRLLEVTYNAAFAPTN